MKKTLLFILMLIFSIQIANADTYSINAGYPDNFGVKNAVTGLAEFSGYPFILKGLYSNPYTAPNGYSLIITGVKMSRENDALKIKPTIAAPASALTAADSAGSPPIGMATTTWTYKVEFYSDYTLLSSGYGSYQTQVVVNSLTKQVNISAIPTSTNITCTARKIWRSSDTSTFYLLTTITNNTDTTYTDTTTDTDLSTTLYSAPATHPTYTVCSGKIGGDIYGNYTPNIQKPFGLNEFEVLSATNDNISINCYLQPTSNIFITRGNLYTSPYNAVTGKYFVINNIYSQTPQSIYAKVNIAVPASTFTSAETAAVSGAMGTGVYYYKVKFKSTLTTKQSNLSADSKTATIGIGDTGSVSLAAIPVSSSAFINARDIYRSKVDDPNAFYYLATINDNSTTTLVDSANDTQLGAIYTPNYPIEILSGYASYNINKQIGNFLGESIIIDNLGIISADNNSAVINGYLMSVK